MTESMIRNQIANTLKGNGWEVLRLNAGRFKVGEGRSRRTIMGVEKGTPDLMAFKATDEFHNYKRIPRIVFIEVKKPGLKPTEVQVRRMKELQNNGAECIVATSWEDVINL